MKQFLIIIVFVLFCSCRHDHSAGQWQTIEVGDYRFDFPPDFELIEEQGIDSYVGKIAGDSMVFHFDFGYYSNRLEQTPEEYLAQGYWRKELSYLFMKNGITYDQTNMPRVDVLSIKQATAADSSIAKGFGYIALCKHDTTEFEFPFSIPAEITQLNFRIDTVDHFYRKIVFAKNPAKGYTGIYLRDLDNLNTSMNNQVALSMVTNSLTQKQQAIALKIFQTVRHTKVKS